MRFTFHIYFDSKSWAEKKTKCVYHPDWVEAGCRFGMWSPWEYAGMHNALGSSSSTKTESEDGGERDEWENYRVDAELSQKQL